MSKRALIFGVTGQDGSYLAELLVQKGYEVYGVRRRSSGFFATQRIDHLVDETIGYLPQVRLRYGDLGDASSLVKLIYSLKPDEIYNLAAQSHVHVSFEVPEYTADVTGVGALRVFEAARETGVATRIYQASSSEMFGSIPPPQSEKTPFHPRSPYGCSKVFAYHVGVNYRESYGMFICNGILFNHESPRRGENFVTRKVTRAVARIRRGLQDKLHLGNMEARRDWGYAPEYVDAMWRMLQQEAPRDYVVATGESHSVREFVEVAFRHAGLNWQDYVETDPRYYRPAEVDDLVGDASRAKAELGWEAKVNFQQLVAIMVDADLALIDRQLAGGKGAIHTRGIAALG